MVDRLLVLVVWLLGPVLLSPLLAAGAQAGPALVFEAATGTVLYAEEPDKAWHPASLTKLMTAYLTFRALKSGTITLNTKVTNSANARRQRYGLALPVGRKMTIDTALKALIVRSANDVAVMLAEKLAGSVPRFVALMNETAREIGMTRTRFQNPNGLHHPDQFSTARDMAILAKRILDEFPEYKPYFALSSMRYDGKFIRSYNRLLGRLKGADGMKTGYICPAGFNIVASATRDGRQLVAVVLGGASEDERNERARALLEHYFAFYGWVRLWRRKTLATLPFDPPQPVAVQDATCQVRGCAARPQCRGKRPRQWLAAKPLARGKARTLKARAQRSVRKSARKKRAATGHEPQRAAVFFNPAER